MNRSRLRYAFFRWVMPRVYHDQLFHMNMAEKAWPKVAAFSAGRQYTDKIESVDCGPKGYDRGSSLLEDYAKTSRPVVLKGYIKSGSWTLDRVKSTVGESVKPVRVGAYDDAPGDPDVVNMRVADFVDHLEGRAPFPHPELIVEGKGPYLANMAFPALEKELPVPKFFPTGVGATVFWLGSFSRTPLHCHQYCDVLLTQLVGRRRVMLVPPHQAPLVGCVPRSVNICTALYDPFEPDAERFPGTNLIHRLFYELESGDALLIPGFWFHAVRLTTPSFAASQFNGSMPLSVGGGPVRPWTERAYAQGWG